MEQTTQPANDIAVEARGLTKDYGSVRALNAVDVKIKSGEYFVLLGPSGGGKTTLLRLIGGFIRPTAGQVFLHGEDVSDLPPSARPTSMVFQSYALFPHMTVAQNVGYGLKLQKIPTDEVNDRVSRMLGVVGLEGFGSRKPHELSGGQQQRVQLARSFVLETDILLLDESLAALDANLRKDMCIELKRLQEKIGMTFIHVTHNQEEAMTVADNMAIIADGDLVEMGRAVDLYEKPERRFTASFIGENNILDGTVSAIDGSDALVDLGSETVAVLLNGRSVSPGDAVSISVRSELVQMVSDGEENAGDLQTLTGTHHESVYLGLVISEIVELSDGREILARRISTSADSTPIADGASVKVGWRKQDAILHIS